MPVCGTGSGTVTIAAHEAMPAASLINSSSPQSYCLYVLPPPADIPAAPTAGYSMPTCTVDMSSAAVDLLTVVEHNMLTGCPCWNSTSTCFYRAHLFLFSSVHRHLASVLTETGSDDCLFAQSPWKPMQCFFVCMSAVMAHLDSVSYNPVPHIHKGLVLYLSN